MGTTPATTTRNGSRQQEPSDATVVAVWPPKYHHASPTGNTPQVRYTRIQGLAFVVSCVSLTGFFAGFGPFGAQEGVLLALYVEVFLLLWRWANELAHDECDLSGWLHHGAFLLAIALIEFNTQWKLRYATLIVVMQSLHYPMALWYLGARSHCILQSSSARSLCVKLFRTSWWVCVGVRAACMILSAHSAFVQGDVTAAILLAALFFVFSWLDKTWTYWFIRRVGNVCDGPLGNVFIVLSVTAGACLARRLLAI
eukprot:Tamp_19641.p1 GENE.Tamp_19641~~Tamp_19641.p1  ORF type:complete len:255 (+),score=9.24 Tamp_19641:162-926(+)